LYGIRWYQFWIGMSGSSGERVAVVTARARSLPALMSWMLRGQMRAGGAEGRGGALASRLEAPAELGAGQDPQQRVVQGPAGHAGRPKALRMAVTPARSVSAVSALENASNVTARSADARPAAKSARSRR